MITLPASDLRSALDVSNEINRRSGVGFAHPNFYRSVEKRQVTLNDPYFADQWHLNNTGRGGTLTPISTLISPGNSAWADRTFSSR